MVLAASVGTKLTEELSASRICITRGKSPESRQQIPPVITVLPLLPVGR